MPDSQAAGGRIVSLDQFRGYTVLGMFLVNFVGGFAACNYVLQHHNTFCSYADTIMPQFFFAVGFAFRLTFTRRAEQLGAAVANYRVVKRLLGLILVSLVVYTVDAPAESWSQWSEKGIWEVIRVPLKREWFQTLTHIAVTSLWILPVIRTSALVRIGFMLSSAALHLVLSQQFYFLWVNNGQPSGIDGGPLGFLTWTIPAITGSLACDLHRGGRGRSMMLMTGWSIALMAVGYLLSCGTRLYDVPVDQIETLSTERFAAQPVVPPKEAWTIMSEQIEQGGWSKHLLAEPPFVSPPYPAGKIGESYRLRKWNYWMMSQRAGTISYLTFAAGFSLAAYLLFQIGCDWLGWQLGVFRTFGSNALAAYVIHMLVQSAVVPFVPRDAPAWYMWSGCGVFMLITYMFVRTLEKNRIYIKL